MKNLMKIAIMVTGLFLTAASACCAAAPLALNGNDYKITAFCRNDAGDYCSKGDIKNDAFIFDVDGEDFIVDSFDGGVLGGEAAVILVKTDSLFTASYEVITQDSLDKYTFDIKGINLIDTILLGRMDIAYYQLTIGGYDKQDETQAFFFGIKK